MKHHTITYRYIKPEEKKKPRKGLKAPLRILLQLVLIVATAFFALSMSQSVNETLSASQLSSQLETIEDYNFIRTLAPIAQKEEATSGLKASITLAQGCLESDYGRSLLSSKYNNLFGIKAYDGEPSVTLQTKEYVNKKWITINGTFRTYSSWSASVTDHTELFVKGVDWDPAHYHNVLTAKTYQQAAQNLQKDGYATDPDYATKLIALIQKFHLNNYDK
ncbi:MAG: glycoside hydrolase family 73 protein [Streptococcaceae bacterium]|nr:glycoside hydrolase family 73 protein [Streptococcaceae bacterium]